MLVDLAEDVGWEDGELAGAVGVVEAAEDVLEGLVVDLEGGRERVGRLGPLALEVEEAGVVALGGALEVLEEVAIHASCVEEGLEPAVRLDAAGLADAQEDDTLDGALDRDVELALGEDGVAECEVAGEQVAPRLDFLEERIVHLSDDPGGGHVLPSFGSPSAVPVLRAFAEPRVQWYSERGGRSRSITACGGDAVDVEGRHGYASAEDGSLLCAEWGTPECGC